jgi:hypothetical protein
VIENDWDTNTQFWSLIGGNSTNIREASQIEDAQFDESFNSANVKLYRVSDAKSQNPTTTHVANGPLKKSMLDSNDCFIIDCGNSGVYGWIGKKCTKQEKISCVMGAKNLMIKNKYSNYLPFVQLIDGGETTAFKAIFSDWN